MLLIRPVAELRVVILRHVVRLHGNVAHRICNPIQKQQRRHSKPPNTGKCADGRGVTNSGAYDGGTALAAFRKGAYRTVVRLHPYSSATKSNCQPINLLGALQEPESALFNVCDSKDIVLSGHKTRSVTKSIMLTDVKRLIL